MKLAPPGAGLPLLQRLYLRYYLGPFVSGAIDFKTCQDHADRTHARIAELVAATAVEEQTRRVLVDPIGGLEDSSRFWSLSMTLEHLVIVGRQIETGIIELSHGRQPAKPADIAAVKPEGTRTAAEARAEFDVFRTGLFERIEQRMGDWNSPTTLRHPWFGPFRARQWTWLLSAHGRIHLNQVQQIRQRL